MSPPQNVPTDRKKRARYRRLIAEDSSRILLNLVTTYALAVIPEFRMTAGRLWSTTAYPGVKSHGTPRKIALSCGNLETLVVLDEGEQFSAFINIKEPLAESKSSNMALPSSGSRYTWLRELGCDLCAGEYQMAEHVIRAHFWSADEMAAALSNERFLDWCYCLDVVQLRKCGSTMYRRFNNMAVVQELAKLAEQREGSIDGH